MEIDWEVEVGGGAPAIDALWTGFVDLRRFPERVEEVAECAAFPPLRTLLLTLNRQGSGFWTAKCDFWRPEPDEVECAPESVSVGSHRGTAAACYVDILPDEKLVFGAWTQAEDCCRRWARELDAIPLDLCRVELVVRQAIAGAAEGFGITAYAAACGVDDAQAEAKLASLLKVLADAILAPDPAKTPPESYNESRRASSSIG